MATKVGIANFIAALAGSMSLLVLPGAAALAAAITTTGATAITIDAWSPLWPLAGNFQIRIGTEKMTVTAGHGTTALTVIRGAGSTTPATHLIAAAVDWITPIPSSRVLEGAAPTDMSTTAGKKFVQRIRLDGMALKIGMGQLRGVTDQQGRKSYEVNCVLFFGVSQTANTSYVPLQSFLETLYTLWRTQSTFPSGSFSSVSDMSWGEPDLDMLQDPAFGAIAITVQTKG